MQKPLDPFYTKPEIAKSCWRFLLEILASVSLNFEELFFVEPSAGTGAFFNLLPSKRRMGLDTFPKCENIITQDFFKVISLPNNPTNNVIIGNPPFGKRGKMAIAFFNHAAMLADTIAFIVPVNFRKYIVHKQLDRNMRFIGRMHLPRDAFYLDSGKTFSVNTEFQIWTRLQSEHEDMRQHQSLPIKHQDFKIWQYNNTKGALKVFNNAFDFAVPCQGWQDYTRKETDEKNCERNKQWILLKAKTSDILKRLTNIDYQLLASECGTAVPGFRKGDLVKAYTEYSKTLTKR